MTGHDLLAILAILALLVLALTMTTTSWWSAAQRTITRQQPRCIGCHTHHLPGHATSTSRHPSGAHSGPGQTKGNPS